MNTINNFFSRFCWSSTAFFSSSAAFKHFKISSIFHLCTTVTATAKVCPKIMFYFPPSTYATDVWFVSQIKAILWLLFWQRHDILMELRVIFNESSRQVGSIFFGQNHTKRSTVVCCRYIYCLFCVNRCFFCVRYRFVYTLSTYSIHIQSFIYQSLYYIAK